MNNIINPSRLKLARMRRQLTIKGLADKVGLSSKMISMYENSCDHIPKNETVEALSNALDYPKGFFLAESPIDDLSKDNVSFRSLKSMKAYQEHSAIAAGQIGIILNEYLESKFPKLPKSNLPDLRSVTPEAASGVIRESWGLGLKSISNIVHLLESKGIKVFSLAENTQAVDAFSFWKDETPYIFLNTQKSGERSRFDAAHELGHLLLHKHGIPQGKDIEAEADTFAANLLMPKETILAFKNPHISIQNILELKKNWKVSAMALIVQMKNIGVLSDWHYRNLIIDASKLGLRSKEIDGIDLEKSGLLPKLFETLASKGRQPLHSLADDLNLPIEEITNLVFKFGVVTGAGSQPSQRPKPGLTLVK